MSWLPGSVTSDEDQLRSMRLRDAARMGTDGSSDDHAFSAALGASRSATSLNSDARDARNGRRAQRMASRKEASSSKLVPQGNGNHQSNNGQNFNGINNDNNNSPLPPRHPENNGDDTAAEAARMASMTNGSGRRVVRSSRGRNSSRAPGAPGHYTRGVVPQFADQTPAHAVGLLDGDEPGQMHEAARASAEGKRARFARQGSKGSNLGGVSSDNLTAAPVRRGGSGMLAEGGWKSSIAMPSRSGSYSQLPPEDGGLGTRSRSKSKLYNNRSGAGSGSDLAARSADASREHSAGAGNKGGADGSDDEESSEGEIDSETATYFMFLDKTEGSRRRACDKAFCLAAVSIITMVLSIETRFHSGSASDISEAFKMATSALTLLTMYYIARYHTLEFHLLQHRHILPKEMSMYQSPSFPLLLLELLVVCLHPPPFIDGTYQIIEPEIPEGAVRPTTSQQGTITPSHPIPIDVLGVVVFFRVYLVLRVLKFHGALYGPAARFIGALNNVDFDLRFMLKALVNQHPFRILGASLLYVLLAVAYSIWAIERERDEFFFFDDSLWFLIVTMTTVGYGDIAPTNHLSRLLTVIAAVIGVTVTALLVAVMSSKLTLSKGEARVVHLLNKDRLRRELYENAAKVMQAAIKFRREVKGKPKSRWGPARVRLFRVLRNWRSFKRALSVYMTDNLASRDMALDDVMVEIVRLSSITELIEDRFDEFGDRFDEMAGSIQPLVSNAIASSNMNNSSNNNNNNGNYNNGNYNNGGNDADYASHSVSYGNNRVNNNSSGGNNNNNNNSNNNANSNGVDGDVSARLADLEHRSKVLTTAVTKTLRKVEGLESAIAATVEEKVAERTAVLEEKIDSLVAMLTRRADGSAAAGGGPAAGSKTLMF